MSIDNNPIVKVEQLPVNDFSKFELFLAHHELPTENIIATAEERARIMRALPEFLDSLPIKAKEDARYLSKFIAGTAVGLFDASLNFLWNEVVLNLRKKISTYGIDYFYDEAIGGTLREQYKDEEQLPLVKDQVLLDTCLKLELVNDILHRKLCHILDMRNHIGSSHPNDYSINSYELLGWLQTCINEVLLDTISESALTVKSIIDNAKRADTDINDEYIAHFENSIKQLSTNMTSNLLTSLFGIFVSPTTNINTQKNIIKLATIAWEYATEKCKYDLGKKIDAYRANLDEAKTKNAELFFEKCNGQSYYSKDAKIIKLTLLCEKLEDVHHGWDNYVNEVPIAKEIIGMFKSIEDIPEIRMETLTRIFLYARIGNDRYYYEGVSPGAKEYYDEFFLMLDEDTIRLAIKILMEKETRYLLSGKYRPKHVKEIFESFNSELVSERMEELINYVISYEGNLSNVFVESKFKQLSVGVL
jgi:hypothetical protein